MGTWLNNLVKPELLYANQPPQTFNSPQDAINAGMAQIPPQDPGLVNTPPANVSLTPPLPSSPGTSYGVMQGDQNPAGGTMPANPAPPGMAISGGGPQMPAPNPMGPLPLFNRPNFEQATTDQYGNTKAPSAPLTKMGALMYVLQGAFRGGSAALASGALNAAPGKSGFGSGWAGAQNEPLEHAGAEQQLQHGGLENTQLGLQTQYYPQILQQGINKTNSEINKNNLIVNRGSGVVDARTGQMLPGTEAPDKGIDPQHIYGAAIQDFQNTSPSDPTWADKKAKVEQIAAAIQATHPDNTKPLSKQQADSLNSMWDTIAVKGGLPAGQFREGMPAADATQLQSAINNVIGKQQGNQRISISLNNAQAAQGNIPLNPESTAAVQAGKTGADYLATVPGSRRGVVEGILTGRQSLPSGFALKTPYWQTIIQDVYNADPQWSEQRAQVRKAFTTGSDGKNIGNLNTAAVHLDALQQAANGLSNGSFVPGNRLYNYVQTQMGGTAPTNFDAIKNAAVGEVASALKGNATDQEIHAISQGIQNTNSPQQLAGFINANIGVLHQKLQTYQQRYEQSNPGDTLWNPILPQAQQVFQQHGVGAGGGISVTAPDGSVHSFTDQKSADNFKQLAGIK